MESETPISSEKHRGPVRGPIELRQRTRAVRGGVRVHPHLEQGLLGFAVVPLAIQTRRSQVQPSPTSTASMITENHPRHPVRCRRSPRWTSSRRSSPGADHCRPLPTARGCDGRLVEESLGELQGVGCRHRGWCRRTKAVWSGLERSGVAVGRGSRDEGADRRWWDVLHRRLGVGFATTVQQCVHHAFSMRWASRSMRRSEEAACAGRLCPCRLLRLFLCRRRGRPLRGARLPAGPCASLLHPALLDRLWRRASRGWRRRHAGPADGGLRGAQHRARPGAHLRARADFPRWASKGPPSPR